MNGWIGFIGGGKMAEAILTALVSSGTVPAARVVVSDVSAERRAHLTRTTGATTTDNNLDVLARADVVFLAVKPQQLDEVTAQLAPHVRDAHLLLSIAAGKRLDYFSKQLPTGRVVRVMPNIAALLAASANAYCLGPRCTQGDSATVRALLDTFGRSVELPEAQFDAVTALSGSGPAFVAYWTDCAVRAGMALGLQEADARSLAYQTLLGTARLLTEGIFTPEALIAAVSSAKGTTVAGMDVLTRTTLATDLQRTLTAAATRSRELSGSA